MSHLEQQIKALTQQVELLTNRVEKLQAENQQLKKENSQLREQNDQLRDKIAKLEKNSSNSSKPPSSDIVDPQPGRKKKKKRKIGGQRGHPKYTRQPFTADEIDQTIIHKLPAGEVCRRGLIPLDETEPALQQIDLPEQLFDVIEHRVQLYVDPRGRTIKAKLPKEIRKAGLFSPRMMALTGYLKARGHMSYSTLQAFFNDILNLDVSQGYLSKICTKKLSAALQPAYSEVAEFIRNAPVVGTDETGHKNPAYKRTWTWCQQTSGAVFFHISNSRASQVLTDILGSDFGGIVVCDYYSANKKFINDNDIKVQYCWAHLVRDIKFLMTLSYKTVQRWAEALLTILRKLFELWKTRRQRHPGRYRRTIEKLRKTFLQKVRRPPDHSDARNIKNRFSGSGKKGYFLFLERDGVPPTNNGTEQAIRFVVIDRRVTQGTRSWAGMRWCERAWTVVATSARHRRSVYQFFLDAINATYADTPYPKLIPANL
jgi:regulator of replication initiation timing